MQEAKHYQASKLQLVEQQWTENGTVLTTRGLLHWTPDLGKQACTCDNGAGLALLFSMSSPGKVRMTMSDMLPAPPPPPPRFPYT